MKPRPSPNIWNTPELYELENRAADPHGRVVAAMREIGDWTGRTFLDVGCGSGFHLPQWAGTASRVVGVEQRRAVRGLAYGFFLWAITRGIVAETRRPLVTRLGTAVEDHGTFELLGC